MLYFLYNFPYQPINQCETHFSLSIVSCRPQCNVLCFLLWYHQTTHMSISPAMISSPESLYAHGPPQPVAYGQRNKHEREETPGAFLPVTVTTRANRALKVVVGICLSAVGTTETLWVRCLRSGVSFVWFMDAVWWKQHRKELTGPVTTLKTSHLDNLTGRIVSMSACMNSP